MTESIDQSQIICVFTTQKIFRDFVFVVEYKNIISYQKFYNIEYFSALPKDVSKTVVFIDIIYIKKVEHIIHDKYFGIFYKCSYLSIYLFILFIY